MVNDKPAADFDVIALTEASRSARIMALRVLEDLEKFNQQVRRTQDVAAELRQRALTAGTPREWLRAAPLRTTPQIPPEDSRRLETLTPREREVLTLIGDGKRTKEIAWHLGISVKTAVTHRSHVMEKLGIHEGPSLVRFAIRIGLCRV